MNNFILFLSLLITFFSDAVKPPPKIHYLHGKKEHTVNIRSSDGTWITVEGGGDGYLISNRDIVGPWQQFTIVCETENCSFVKIRAPNPAYWISETGWARASQQNAARFKLTRQGNEGYTLQNRKGEYWSKSLEDPYKDEIHMVTLSKPDKNEIFYIKQDRMINHLDNQNSFFSGKETFKVSIKPASNNYFITSESNQGELRTTRPWVNQYGIFDLHCYTEDCSQVSFKRGSNWVSPEGALHSSVHANKVHAPNKHLRLVLDSGKSAYYIQNSDGYYWTLEKKNKQDLNKKIILSTEKSTDSLFWIRKLEPHEYDDPDIDHHDEL